ncbi:MAG: glycosyltransferase family 9 protein [Myxococcota bacterium]
MSPQGASIAARAPNHLGDGVMALPAMHALAALGPLTIHAPAWGADLYAEVDATVAPRQAFRADLAVLFAPSLRAALEARRSRRIVGTPTDFRRLLLTDVVPAQTHQADTYGALARAAGAHPSGAPTYGVRGRTPSLPPAHIGLNPLAKGGTTREWPHFAALARELVAAGHRVVFYAGPGEAERLAPIAADHLQAVGLPLPDFAAALDRCAVFVSNDSGAAHFARACNTPTVVVHGSTSAARTGPHGAVALEHAVPCHPCYRPTCSVGLGCLGTPVSRVLAAVQSCSPS